MRRKLPSLLKTFQLGQLHKKSRRNPSSKQANHLLNPSTKRQRALLLKLLLSKRPKHIGNLIRSNKTKKSPKIRDTLKGRIFHSRREIIIEGKGHFEFLYEFWEGVAV